jgi:hypothetical protein
MVDCTTECSVRLPRLSGVTGQVIEVSIERCNVYFLVDVWVRVASRPVADSGPMVRVRLGGEYRERHDK